METLNSELAGLIGNLSPAERRKLAGEIGKSLRASNQKRIAAQVGPDGTAYEKRKKQTRPAAGRLKAKMFAKLRTARFLKVTMQGDGVAVGFVGRVARIARVHQYGLQDKTSESGPTVRYSQRQLLGFSDDDVAAVADLTLAHLSK